MAEEKRPEQHKSLAVITVMETQRGGLVITSEGTGAAGEWCDEVVNLMRVVLTESDGAKSDPH